MRCTNVASSFDALSVLPSDPRTKLASSFDATFWKCSYADALSVSIILSWFIL